MRSLTGRYFSGIHILTFIFPCLNGVHVKTFVLILLSVDENNPIILQGAPLSCLWFGPAYFGTSRVENVVLRNNAPQACDWVCLLQDTAAETEVVSDAPRLSRHGC